MRAVLPALVRPILLLALGCAVASGAGAGPRERIGPLILEAGPGAERALERLADDARGIVPRLEADLGVRFAGPFRMVLIAPNARGRLADPMLVGLDEGAPPWAAGYVVTGARLGAIRLGLSSQYPYGSPTSVLAHEATHVLLHDAAGERLPLWFQEGVATLEGRRWSLEDWVIDAANVLGDEAPTLDELNGYFGASEPLAREAYASSFSFVSWVVGARGPGVLPDLLRAARDRPFADAWAAATGSTLAADEAAWRKAMTIRYRWAGALTASATLWLLVSVLAFLIGAWRRWRQRRVRERWPDEPDEGPDGPDGWPAAGEAGPPSEAQGETPEQRRE
jgi:hypothetical protein